MIVMDPDHIVFAQQRCQLFSEQCVDPAVRFAGAAIVIDQVQAEVQQRPQRAVGKPVVVPVNVALVEVHGHITDVTLALLMQGATGLFARLPAPSEPHAAAFLKRREQADGQAAGGGLARYRDPVGDHHQPTHDASCQLRDSRMAAVIRPTCE